MSKKIAIFLVLVLTVFYNGATVQAVNTTFKSSPTIDSGQQINFTDGGWINNNTFHSNGSLLNLSNSSNTITLNGGNVGIGTTNPQTKLHIYNSTVGGLNETLRSQGYWSTSGSGSLLRFTNYHASGLVPNAGEYNLAGIAGVDDTANWGGSLYFQTAPTGTSGGSALQNRMVINASGNVGIGTTSPTTPWSKVLQIYDPSNASLSIKTSGKEWHIMSDASNYLGFVDYNGGAYTRRMVIDTNGNVGIGTNAPGARLDVSATGGFKNSYATTLSLLANNGNAIVMTDNTGVLYSTSTASFVSFLGTNNLWNGTKNGNIWNGDAGAGNVGVGTTNPTVKFQIGDGAATNAKYSLGSSIVQYYWAANERAAIAIDTNNAWALGSSTAGAGGIRLGNGTNFSYLVGAGTNLLLNPTAGNVGIGTSTPSYPLTIGVSNATGLYVGKTTGGEIDAGSIHLGGNDDQINNSGGSGFFDILSGYQGVRIGPRTGTSTLTALNTGNVGIGITNPVEKFQVANTSAVNIRVSSTENNIRFQTSAGSNPTAAIGYSAGGNGGFLSGLVFSAYDGSSWKNNMFIDNGGNIGISSTNPSTKLDVAGSLRNTGATTHSLLGGGGNLVVMTDNTGTLYAGGTALTGSGIANYTARWTATSTLSTGVLYDNGTNVGVGTTSPNFKLDVNGILNITGDSVPYGSGLSLGYSATNGYKWIQSFASQPLYINPLGNNVVLNSGSGNVGIGATTPNVKLDVRGNLQVGSSGNSSSTNWPLFINDASNLGWKVADGSGTTKFELYVGYGGANEMRLFNGVKLIGGNQDLTLGTTNNGSAVTIQNNTAGNVGIGTTNPVNKLQTTEVSQTEFYGSDNATPVSNLLLQGTEASRTVGKGPALTFSFPANSDGTNIWSQARILATPDNANSGDARGRLYLQVRDNYNPGVGGSWNWRTGLMIAANGNVGIGTTNPGTKLDISGSLKNTAATTHSLLGGGGNLVVMTDNTGTLYAGGSAITGSGIANYTARWTSASNLSTGVLYDNGTNVGIGTTNPTSALYVNATTAGDGGTNNGLGSALYIKQNTGWSGQQPWALYVADGGYTYLSGFRVEGPGGLRSLMAVDPTKSIGFATAGDQPITFTQSQSTERMRIAAGGNVGIGLTNPTYKLDVAGGLIRQSGYLVADAATDNLVANGDFELNSASGWSTGTVVTGGYSGNYALQITGSNTLTSDDYIPVDPTKDIFQLDAWIKKSVAGGTPGLLYFGYIAYDANKGVITSAPCGTYCYFAASGYNLPADGAWHKFSATTVGEGTSYPNFPVGTKYVRVLGLINYSGSSDAVTLIDHVTLKRLTKGPLIAGNNFSSSNLNDQNQYSTLYTTAANNLILNSPGNVGIGITNPGNNLDVTGSFKNTSATTHSVLGGGGNVVVMADNNGTLYTTSTVSFLNSGSLWSGTKNGNIWNGDAGAGNVGIGTTAPGAKLDVVGNFRSTGADVVATINASSGYGARIDFQNNGASKVYSGVVAIDNWGGLPNGTLINDGFTRFDGSKYVFTASASTQVMALLSNGNVGIGITNPAQKLDINGDGARLRLSTASAPATYYFDIQSNYNSTDTVNFYGTGGYNILKWNYNNKFLSLQPTGGNVGIGLTNPAFNLHVSGSGGNYNDGTIAVNPSGQVYPGVFGRFQEANDVGGGNSYFTYIANDMYHTNGADESSYYVYNQWIDGQALTMNAEGFKFLYADAATSGTTTVATELMRVSNSGNVGIGLTNPGVKLDLSTTFRNGGATTHSLLGGSGNAIVMTDNTGTLYAGGAALTGSGIANYTARWTSTSALSTGVLYDNGTNVGIGTTNATSPLTVNGSIAATGMSLTGALNMNSQNITGVNKLTVGAIDPLYSINGIKYSTYASSIVGGIKEEYTGKASLSHKNSVTGEYEAIIDFTNLAAGSDLWIWRKVVDFNKDNVEVSFAPYGRSAQAYYLIDNNKLIFRADRRVEISYRLVGKRFDWRNWPTLATDQTEKGIEVK